jgi:hypothetical protein
VLGKIFGPKREKTIVGCRKLHNKEFHTLRFSPNSIKVITSMKMKSTGHLARMWEISLKNYEGNKYGVRSVKYEK